MTIKYSTQYSILHIHSTLCVLSRPNSKIYNMKNKFLIKHCSSRFPWYYLSLKVSQSVKTGALINTWTFCRLKIANLKLQFSAATYPNTEASGKAILNWLHVLGGSLNEWGRISRDKKKTTSALRPKNQWSWPNWIRIELHSEFVHLHIRVMCAKQDFHNYRFWL